MRILHISTRLILGGSQENTVLSCEGQAGLGHEVHLAFGPIYGPEGSLLDRVTRFRTHDGRAITTHTVPHLVREVSPLADFRGYRELRDLIARIQPDIVHTHSSKAGILGRAAAWSFQNSKSKAQDHRLGIVHTIHGPPFMPIENTGVRRLAIRANNFIYTLAERYAARRCHLIVSVADAMTREFLSRRIGCPDQYVTVRSGMDVAPFLSTGPDTRRRVRRNLGLSDSDLVIGTVARLADHKGHDDLLTAVGEDLRAHPHWKLLWIGDGWLRKPLIARAQEAGLGVVNYRGIETAAGAESSADSVPTRTVYPAHPASAETLVPRPPQILLTGLIPPEQIPETISAMDILAHPSYREGLPRTVPQALLCGVPPIAYDVDGTAEACRDMQTGRLIPLGDTAALRAGINWLIDHPAERQAMAARGREECRGVFSAEHMVDELEKVYARALAMV